MIKYIKDSLWVIPLFLILSLPILFVLDGGFYSVWDINIPPISPELQLEKYFFINSPSSMGGRNFNLTTYLPLIAETWFFSLFMPVNWANSTVFYLHYFLTGISMYILIRYLFDHQILNRKATVAAIIGGILAMFNEYWFLRAHYNFNIIFLTAFSPLVLMYLHKLCMQDGRVFVLRLDEGDIVPDCIEQFAEDNDVTVGHAVLVGGLGSGQIVVGPRKSDEDPPDPMLIPVDGAHEVAAVGVLAPGEDGKPILHMHGALGRSGQTMTGCLRPGVKTWLVGEVILYEILGTDAMRVKDKKSGFALLEVGK